LAHTISICFQTAQVVGSVISINELHHTIYPLSATALVLLDIAENVIPHHPQAPTSVSVQAEVKL